MCYCAIKIYLSSFSILKIAVLRHKIVENYKALGTICITVSNFMKISQ